MVDPFTIGGLAIAGNLLGSLNRSKPKDVFEAEKILDEQDPVRKTLEKVPRNVTLADIGCYDFQITLVTGEAFTVAEIYEIGYGAFSCKTRTVKKVSGVPFGETPIMVIRYSSVVSVRIDPNLKIAEEITGGKKPKGKG